MDNVIIRQGEKKDVHEIFVLVRELAIFEKAEHEVETTVTQLMEDGFGPNPLYGVIVAQVENKIIGMSLYCFRYSTWKGKRLYVEDIIVTENYRGKGIGQLLFEATVKKAKQLNCNGMSWLVLNWNETAINFYKKYDANFDREWVSASLSRGGDG